MSDEWWRLQSIANDPAAIIILCETNDCVVFAHSKYSYRCFAVVGEMSRFVFDDEYDWKKNKPIVFKRMTKAKYQRIHNIFFFRTLLSRFILKFLNIFHPDRRCYWQHTVFITYFEVQYCLLYLDIILKQTNYFKTYSILID